MKLIIFYNDQNGQQANESVVLPPYPLSVEQIKGIIKHHEDRLTKQGFEVTGIHITADEFNEQDSKIIGILGMSAIAQFATKGGAK